MSPEYENKLKKQLGLQYDCPPQDLPFRTPAAGWILDPVSGAPVQLQLNGSAVLHECRECPSDAVNALSGFCRVKSSVCGDIWLTGIRDETQCLQRMKELYLISGAVYERLTAFLRVRPCLTPPLHPGIGLVYSKAAGIVYPAALLRTGWGEASRGLCYPAAMNLELTSQCPLRCPQCYCHLHEGRHMPLETAAAWLKQAGELGVCTVNLSGGETMCYPWIYDVIREARKNGIEPDVALSGFNITDESLDKLIQAGVNGIYVSLNGPTKEINAHTRDGYELAVNLLELLSEREFSNVWINWVVHCSNADTLPEMIKLAEKYRVRGIMIMAFKPDRHNELASLPSARQMLDIAETVKNYTGSLELVAESCYSSMKALLGRSFWGNSNKGPFKGCGAGRDSFSVSLEGRLTPCRHLELFEDYDSLENYWNSSPVLERLRCVDDSIKEPCSSCEMCGSCRHCMAVNLKLNGSIFRGDATCPIGIKNGGRK